MGAGTGYLWLKAFHVAAIVAWMAAMLYLPRLMVYHVAAPAGSPQSETFKLMERRLLRSIATPALLAVWVSGLVLATMAGFWSAGWLHVKLLAVIAMSGIHGYLAGAVRAFAGDRNKRSARFYRVLNEVPAILLLIIVVMAIVKPF